VRKSYLSRGGTFHFLDEWRGGHHNRLMNSSSELHFKQIHVHNVFVLNLPIRSGIQCCIKLIENLVDLGTSERTLSSNLLPTPGGQTAVGQ
jgi:hypothetical protein